MQEKVLYGFPVCGSSKAHAQSRIWATHIYVLPEASSRLYYMSANSNDSGETVLMRRFVLTLQVAYMISTIFSCAGFIIITYVNQVCFETEII